MKNWRIVWDDSLMKKCKCMQSTDLPNQITNMSYKWEPSFQDSSVSTILSATEWLEIFFQISNAKKTEEEDRTKRNITYIFIIDHFSLICAWRVVCHLCSNFYPCPFPLCSSLYAAPYWLTRRTASSWSPSFPQSHHLISHLDGHLIATSTYHIACNVRQSGCACMSK